MPISLLDIVYPAACVVCGTKPKPLCVSCIPIVSMASVPGFGFPVLAALPHQGAIERMIAGYKDQQLVSLEAALANLVNQLLREVDVSSFSVIVTPARNSKNFRKRGFDPAYRLVKRAVGEMPWVKETHALRPTRMLEDQRRLGREDREANVANSMRLVSKVRGPVLLFDDVMTTGSTIREMARACRALDVEVVGCCVLAQRISTF